MGAGVAGGLYGGIVGGCGLGIGLAVGLGVGVGALGSLAFSLLFPVGALSGTYALARRLVRGLRAKRVEQVRRIADSLVAAINAEIAKCDAPNGMTT